MSASTSMARTQMPKQASKWQLNWKHWKHCNVLASRNGAMYVVHGGGLTSQRNTWN